MRSVTLKSRHKFLLGLMMILVCLLVAEGVARLVSGPTWVNPYYSEMSKGFALLDELNADKQHMFAQGQKYYDEFLYGTAPVSLTHVNFTDYYSARSTPDSVPLSQAENIVWTFGGSTMMNTETTDELTIANTLAVEFGKVLGPTHVKNFGEGSFFSSYELIKFQKLLREVPEDEMPTMVLFYDGYNDAHHSFLFGAGNMQRDLSLKLQSLVEGKYLTLWTYALSQKASQLSKLWETTGGRFVQYTLFPPAKTQGSNDNLEAGVRVYLSNVKMIEASCEAYDINCFFILQPLIVTKTPLTPLEQEVLANLKIGAGGIDFVRRFYKNARRSMEGNDLFIDASHIMNGRTESDFYDLGHTAATTPPFIGKRIASMVLDRLGTKGGS